MIKKFFSPPVFQSDEDNFRARFINSFAWIVIFLFALTVMSRLTQPATDFTIPVLTGLIIVMISALYLLHRQRISASGTVIIVLGWLGLGIQAYTADGVKDAIIFGYIALGLLASIIVSWRAGSLAILSGIGVIWALTLLEINGYITPQLQDIVGFSRDLTFAFIVIAVLIYLSTISLQDAVVRANKSEAELRISNKEFQELNQKLEDRVTIRTSELEFANQRNEKRVKQFEAIAQVARATISNESLENLLPRLASLISDQFGFYHTGIFLLNEDRSYAVLRAANSEGGKRMLARGHQLQVGQTGMVGFVSAVGRSRIALDVGADAVFFDNPDLPNTRSEMALPLRVGDETIGVLDVQSIAANAFQEDDVEVLSTLADQVAIAIQNARTYEQMRRLLTDAQKASGSQMDDSWRLLQSGEMVLGVHVAGNQVHALKRPLTSVHVKKAEDERRTVVEHGTNAALAIPIRLRNQVIGVMDIRTNDEREWEQDEVDVAEAVADRLSLALETSLLLKSTQRRADIERLTADVTGKIGATTQFDSILRTAAEELSRVLGSSEVLVQIQSEAAEPRTKNAPQGTKSQ